MCHKVPNRSSRVGLSTLDEDAAFIEAEVAVLESKVSESTASRVLIN